VLADEAVQAAGLHAAERKLIDHQVVRHRLAELTAQVRIAHALVHELWRDGVDMATVREVAAFVADQTGRVVDGCLSVFGGLGYMADHWISRAYRDTRSLSLVLGHSGAPEWMRPAPSFRNSAQPADMDQFKREVADFAARRITPYLEDWEKTGAVPRSLFTDFASTGYLGLVVPRAMGGAGRDIRYSMALLEGLMDWRMASIAVSLMLPANTICPLLVRYATPQLQQELLTKIVAGSMIPSLAITEPGGSSNLVHTLRTTAKDSGDHWTIDGEKIFITNGPIADVVFVLARSKPKKGPLSATLIAVPTDTPGFKVVERHAKLGIHSSPTGRLLFEGCRVPKRYTIGLVHHGYAYFNEVISGERLLIAAGSVALAVSCLGMTMKCVPHAACVELRTDVVRMQACRALCYEVADSLRRNEQTTMHCWLAKFAVCEAANSVIGRCARKLTSPEDRAWIEQVACDARVFTIFAGASDIMRDLYAARLAGRFRLMQRLGSEPT
jgi:alkylation response protein AidB-like acyl-CoA dehydrogenase